MRVHHEKGSDWVRDDREKKSELLRVQYEKTSDGVRVDHEKKEPWGEC